MYICGDASSVIDLSTLPDYLNMKDKIDSLRGAKLNKVNKGEAYRNSATASTAATATSSSSNTKASSDSETKNEEDEYLLEYYDSDNEKKGKSK